MWTLGANADRRGVTPSRITRDLERTSRHQKPVLSGVDDSSRVSGGVGNLYSQELTIARARPAWWWTGFRSGRDLCGMAGNQNSVFRSAEYSI
jgi:hypothetical protein